MHGEKGVREYSDKNSIAWPRVTEISIASSTRSVGPHQWRRWIMGEIEREIRAECLMGIWWLSWGNLYVFVWIVGEKVWIFGIDQREWICMYEVIESFR